MRFLFSSIFIQKSKRSHTMREPRLVYVGSPAAGEPLGQPASPCPCRFRASGLCCITVIFSKHRIFKLLPWGGRARPHSPGPHQALRHFCCLPRPTLAQGHGFPPAHTECGHFPTLPSRTGSCAQKVSLTQAHWPRQSLAKRSSQRARWDPASAGARDRVGGA